MSTSGGYAGTFNPPTDFSGVVVYPDEAAEGQNIAYVKPDTTVSQVLSGVLTENAAYTLLVEIGNRADSGGHDYAVELRAGGEKLAEDLNSLNPAEGTFVTSTVSYDVLPGDSNLGHALEIRLIGIGNQANFDNVRLNAEIVTDPASVIIGDVADGQVRDNGQVFTVGALSTVGTQGDPPLKVSDTVYFFELPALTSGSSVERITAAILQFNYSQLRSVNTVFNVDLYGLGWISKPPLIRQIGFGLISTMTFGPVTTWVRTSAQNRC